MKGWLFEIDIIQWIEGLAFFPEFEMEIGAIGFGASLTHYGYRIAGLYFIAHSFEERTVVLVLGHDAVAVLDHKGIARDDIVVSLDNFSVERSQDFGVFFWVRMSTPKCFF